MEPWKLTVSVCWVETSGVLLGEIRFLPVIDKEGRERLKKVADHFWLVGVTFNKHGVFTKEASLGSLQTSRSLHLLARVSIEASTGFSHVYNPSQQHLTLCRLRPWNGSGYENGGGTYIPRIEGGVRNLVLSGSSSGVDQKSRLLDDFLYHCDYRSCSKMPYLWSAWILFLHCGKSISSA